MTKKTSDVTVLDTAKIALLEEQEEVIRRAAFEVSGGLEKIALALSTIKAGRLYRLRGSFKTVAEYAQATFDIKASLAYSLSKAGDILLLPDCPQEIRALPVSTVSELSGLTTPELKKVAKKAATGLTQKQAREEAVKIRKAAGRGKSRGTPGYTDTTVVIGRNRDKSLTGAAVVHLHGAPSVEFDSAGFTKIGDAYVKIHGDTIVIRRKGIS